MKTAIWISAVAACLLTLTACGEGSGGTCTYSCSGGGGGNEGASSGSECQGICNTQCGQKGRSCGSYSYVPG